MGSSSEAKVLEGIHRNGLEFLPDEQWVPSSSTHDAPVVKVSEPSGKYWQMDSRFSVPLPPDDVYEIIIDPNNRRVFKNVKEVTYRKVLEDDGNRQLVELEQLGRWRFLIFNGAFACRVKVDQNREQHSMHCTLSKQGMMKKFEGSWKIEPIYEADGNFSEDVSSSEEGGKHRLTGSWVTLMQVVQPAFVPPWPLRTYMKGVCGQIIQDICVDLQVEAMRLAELKGKNSDMNEVD